MDLKEKMLKVKNLGITIKFLSLKTEISEATLYSFSCGKRELSKEKAEKLNKILDNILSL